MCFTSRVKDFITQDSIVICDWISENVHSSHIRFCSFADSQKLQGMVYTFETSSDNKGIVALQSLNVSHLFVIPNRFYESPNLKNGCINYARFPKSSHIFSFHYKGRLIC